MLTRSEKYFLPGSEVDPRVQEVARTLAEQGFETTLKPGVGVSGTGPKLGSGVRLHAELVVEAVGAGLTMDLQARAEISTSRIALIVLSLLVFFPIGLVLAIRTYRKVNDALPDLLEHVKENVRRVTSIAPSPPRLKSGHRIRTSYVPRGDARRRSG